MTCGPVRSRLVGGLLRALRVRLSTWTLLDLVLCDLLLKCGGTRQPGPGESQISPTNGVLCLFVACALSWCWACLIMRRDATTRDPLRESGRWG